MLRSSHFHRPGEISAKPFDVIVLAQDERHLRRKLLTLRQGGQVMVDLPEPVMLQHGDVLMLEDGRAVAIVAAEEALYAVTARDGLHLAELAWHLGNRHLPAQIEENRILIQRDHVIKAMLEGLGAAVSETVEPFQPMRGAYHAHGGHEHGSHSDHHHV